MSLSIMQLFGHPTVQGVLKDAKPGELEKAFGEKARKILDLHLPFGRVEHFITQAEIAAYVLDNMTEEERKKYPLMAIQAKYGLIACAASLKDMVYNAYRDDWGLKATDKDGNMHFIDDEGQPLHGVTDEKKIIDTCMAWYANEKSRNSRFRSELEFNTQRSKGNIVQLDLTDPKAKPSKPGMIGYTDQARNVHVHIDEVRVNFHGPVSIIMAPSEDKRDVERTPSNLIVPPQMLACIKSGKMKDMSSAFLTAEPSVWALTDSDGKKRNVPVNLKELHERITSYMENPKMDTYISPALMQEFEKDDNGHITMRIPVIGDTVLNVEPENFTVLDGEDGIKVAWEAAQLAFNNPSNPASATEVPEVIDVKVEPKIEQPTHGSEDTPPASAGTKLQLPITTAMCKGQKGKYKCLVCGSELKKAKNLMVYTPSKLPEGMPHDTPGLEESQQFAMSVMCGKCRDKLKAQREKTIGAWITANKAKDVVTVKPKVETHAESKADDKKLDELCSKIDAAENQVKAAEGALKAVEAARDAYIANDGAPGFMDKAIEDAKFNLQAAQGNLAQLNAEMDALDSSKAKPLALPPSGKLLGKVPTKGQARIVKKVK